MSTDVIDCYILPATPLPLLLPTDCIAEVVQSPEIEPLEKVAANWMMGHATWNNQRLSIISCNALLDSTLGESKQSTSVKDNAQLIVLNPIPGAIRKAYTGMICYGDVEQVAMGSDIEMADLPNEVDKRYVEGAIKTSDQQYLVPRLTALAVAFSYF